MKVCVRHTELMNRLLRAAYLQRFTDGELDVLSCLAVYKDQYLGAAEIAHLTGLTDGSVRVLLHRVRPKLEAANVGIDTLYGPYGGMKLEVRE